MSFDTFYPNRKDRRKKYYGSKDFDRTCRNHGSCPYCQGNRKHKNERRKMSYLNYDFDDVDYSYEIGPDGIEPAWEDDGDPGWLKEQEDFAHDNDFDPNFDDEGF